MANPALRMEFVQAVIDATVSRLVGISADDVQVVLSKGSIKVELIISPSSPDLVGEVVSSLQTGEDTGALQKKVLDEIQSIPKIDSVCTGALGVIVTDSVSEKQSRNSAAPPLVPRVFPWVPTTSTSTRIADVQTEGTDSSNLPVASSSMLLAIAAWVALP